MEREQPGDESAVQPATVARVWLSKLGTPGNEIEGSLSLTPEHLRFDHRRGIEHERIPLTSIRKVKRPFGSAVLFVEYGEGDEEPRLAFFLVQPPPVDVEGSQVRSRRKRSDNAGFMWQQAGNVAELVKAWRDAVRDAVKRARRESGG